MEWIIYLLAFCWGVRVLIGTCGIFGIVMLFGTAVFAFSFGGGNGGGAMLGIGLIIIPFVWALAKSIDTPNGQQQAKKYTEQIKETEKEYGIIDFSEKEK